MAFIPINGIVPQATANGNQANGMVLKFYEPGTLTPLAVATDSTGATLTTEFLLDIEGYTTLSGSREIPHVDQIYKVVLYLDQADADANDTGSAIYVIDDIDLVLPNVNAAAIAVNVIAIAANADGIAQNTARPLDEIKADTTILPDTGIGLQSTEYTTGTGYGTGLYEKVSVDPGNNLINPATSDGNWLSLIPNENAVNIFQAGAISDWNGATGTDNSAAIKECSNYADVNGFKVVDLPPGDFLVTEVDTFKVNNTGNIEGFHWRGSGMFVTTFYFINTDAATDNYLVDNQNAEQFVEYSGISFEGDQAQANARWMRMDSSGQAQSPRHFGCRWKFFEQIFLATGPTNASESLWNDCKVRSTLGKAFLIDNVQAVNHNFNNCDMELTQDSLFFITKGGCVNVFGGSYILNQGALIELSGGSVDIGTSNWNYNFYGIRTELRDDSTLVSNSSAGFVKFADCNLTVITGGDPSREIGYIGPQGMVTISGGSINGAFTLDANNSSYANPIRVSTLIVEHAYLDNEFVVTDTVVSNDGGRGRYRIDNCKMSQGVDTEFTDVDYNWKFSFDGMAAKKKTGSITFLDGNLPNVGTSVTVRIPLTATIEAVRLVHIGSGGANAGQIWTLKDGSGGVTHETFTFDTAVDENTKFDKWIIASTEDLRTLVLAPDPGNNAGFHNGYVELDWV